MGRTFQRLLSAFCALVIAFSVCTFAQAAKLTFPFDTVATDTVNMRRSASAHAIILERVAKGDTVTVTGESGNYFKVTYKSRTGYILKTYLSTDAESMVTPAPTEIPTATGYPYETVTTDKVNLRARASLYSSILKKIPKGATVTVTKITGSWAADVDMTEYLNEMLSEDEEIGQFLTLDNFTIKLLAEFKEDGTYTMAGDPESAQAAMDSLKEQLKGALTDYLQAMIDESGMDTTVEELLTEADMTMDDLMAEMDEAYSAEDLVGDLNTEGKYLFEDGKLALSDSLDEEADIAEYEAATLEGDTLTLTGGEDADSEFAGLYPIVFERQ